jgi:hypothetical protein
MREVIANILLKLMLSFFDAPNCHKEAMGYRCQHIIYPNGRKECGY